jgi:ABC-type multidrug transport system ATPase subunit
MIAESASPSPAISVDVVTHRFKSVTALRDFSCAIGAGVTGLLGPNGAGKTTLMRLLTGIYPIQSGEIRIEGYPLSSPEGRDAAAARIGYLPQTFGIYGNFTVREFVAYFSILHGLPASSLDDAVDDALNRVDLYQRAKDRMRSLSGGMVRRAGIATAIAHHPSVLILDEPTAGLDPDQRYRLRETLRDLSADTAVLISTHLSEDIAAFGGDVLVVNEGQLRFCGTVRDLEAMADRADLRSNDMRTPVEKGYSVAQTLPPMQRPLVAAA